MRVTRLRCTFILFSVLLDPLTRRFSQKFAFSPETRSQNASSWPPTTSLAPALQ